MKARFIEEIGTQASLRIYWGGAIKGDPCPGPYGCHNAKIPILTTPEKDKWDLGGEPADWPAELWPKTCDHCGVPVPEDARRQVFRERLYNTASGQPEPGDLYWAKWYHEPEDKRHYCRNWDNCSDPRGHLIAVLPNGHEWDIDSRANNCTRPDDKTHRCWCRHGEPPLITVDKNGDTCQAGAGSILSSPCGNRPGWHGFLINGEFREC